MRAADFYTIVRRELGPWLRSCGFRRSGADVGLSQYPKPGLWIKSLLDPGPMPAPDRLIVSFDHSKWGWLPQTGGEFRIQLEAGACADIQFLVDQTQRRHLLELSGQVIDNIRTQFPASGRNWRAKLAELAAPNAIGFLPYYSEADIVAWANLARGWIPDLAATLSQDPAIAHQFQARHS